MKALCFGSLNIDYTYRVPHFVRKGETLAARSLQVFSGGKGMNQAVALARAGAPTQMAGAIGQDGLFLLEQLRQAGAGTGYVRVLENERTGNAFIQNDDEGDNCILLYGGANQAVSKEQIDRVLEYFQAGDYLVLQNEISQIPYLMERGHERGMKLVLNPSPMERAVLDYPLEYVDIFMLNRLEGEELLGRECPDEKELLEKLGEKYPAAEIVLTLGEKGSLYRRGETVVSQPAYSVKTVDTTGAGDTFTGFFVSGLMKGLSPKDAMKQASKAAALAVTRQGAAPSIPTLEEVEAFQV